MSVSQFVVVVVVVAAAVVVAFVVVVIVAVVVVYGRRVGGCPSLEILRYLVSKHGV